jgi:hypothetical protein
MFLLTFNLQHSLASFFGLLTRFLHISAIPFRGGTAMMSALGHVPRQRASPIERARRRWQIIALDAKGFILTGDDAGGDRAPRSFCGSQTGSLRRSRKFAVLSIKVILLGLFREVRIAVRDAGGVSIAVSGIAGGHEARRRTHTTRLACPLCQRDVLADSESNQG